MAPKSAGERVGVVVHPLAEGTGTIALSPQQTNYTPGTSVTLIATAGRYYSFSRWSDGDTNNPRRIIVTDYVFTAIFTNTVPLETHILRQWDQSYAGPGFNYLTALAPGADGGYLLDGYANGGAGLTKTSTNYGYYDFWVVKVDFQGKQQWDADFGGAGADYRSGVSRSA